MDQDSVVINPHSCWIVYQFLSDRASNFESTAWASRPNQGPSSGTPFAAIASVGSFNSGRVFPSVLRSMEDMQLKYQESQKDLVNHLTLSSYLCLRMASWACDYDLVEMIEFLENTKNDII